MEDNAPNPYLKNQCYDPKKADQRIEEATNIRISEIRNQFTTTFDAFKGDLTACINDLRLENAKLREENVRLKTQLNVYTNSKLPRMRSKRK